MNRRVLTALSASLLWVGCQARLFTVHVDKTDQITVEHGTIIEQLLDVFGFLEFLDMDLTTSQELEDQGVQPGDIQGVVFEHFELAVIDPLGEDLSFLDAMTIYLEAPGLEPILVAQSNSFEQQAQVVFHLVPEVDITDYLVSRAMTLTSEITGHRPSVDIQIEARFSLAVGVTGQGACNQLTGSPDSASQ